MQLQGKASIVTGSSSGVGRATAHLLANQGCAVVVNYAHSLEGAEETAAVCERRGAKATVVQADVSKHDDCRAMSAQAEKAS